MPMKNDDQRLAALAARGDQDAFAQLVERYAGMVYSLALQRVGAHHDAEDIAQTPGVPKNVAEAVYKFLHEEPAEDSGNRE